MPSRVVVGAAADVSSGGRKSTTTTDASGASSNEFNVFDSEPPRLSQTRASRSSRERRRALEILTGTPHGVTEHFLLGHGLLRGDALKPCARKLAIVVTEPVADRGVTLMVERIRIGRWPNRA
jgi:hypothetical protein